MVEILGIDPGISIHHAHATEYFIYTSVTGRRAAVPYSVLIIILRIPSNQWSRFTVPERSQHASFEFAVPMVPSKKNCPLSFFHLLKKIDIKIKGIFRSIKIFPLLLHILATTARFGRIVDPGCI